MRRYAAYPATAAEAANDPKTTDPVAIVAAVSVQRLMKFDFFLLTAGALVQNQLNQLKVWFRLLVINPRLTFVGEVQKCLFHPY